MAKPADDAKSITAQFTIMFTHESLNEIWFSSLHNMYYVTCYENMLRFWYIRKLVKVS